MRDPIGGAILFIGTVCISGMWFYIGAATVKYKLHDKEIISQSGVYTTYSAVRRYGK